MCHLAPPPCPRPLVLPSRHPPYPPHDEGAEHAGGLGCVQGVCDTPWGVLVCFWAVVCVPEWGRAEGIAIIDKHVVDDVAGCVDM
jgi:hypothetical protein